MTYTLEANLYATMATTGQSHDNDTISVIAAAKTEGSTMYVVEAVRNGEGSGNGVALGVHWGFVYSEVDTNTNQTLKREVIPEDPHHRA